MTPLAQWMLALMLAAVPPGRSRIVYARETAEEGTARYTSIAEAVAAVVADPAEAPLPARKAAREKTGALLLAVALHEGGWRKDVDAGAGPLARGDHGRSCTLWQFNLGATGKTAEGWGCKELLADRGKAARAALHLIRRSAGAGCKGGADGWLQVYGSGRCGVAVDASKAIVRMAQRWVAARPPPVVP